MLSAIVIFVGTFVLAFYLGYQFGELGMSATNHPKALSD
jgi:hypothetical protein